MTSAYALTGSPRIIIRNSDGLNIAVDPLNTDYQAYQVWVAAGGVPDPYVAPPPPPQVVLPQDLMAQFTAADMVKINAARAADATGATDLLWYSMVAQRDPMVVTNARFLAGWSALVRVLGQARMNAIATALGATSLVV